MAKVKKDNFRANKKARAWELDALRGLAILAVVWDHIMYDFAFMFYYEWRYMEGTEGLLKISEFARAYEFGMLRNIFWPVFVFIFFFVSGTCTEFSRNNFLRGLKLAVVAVLVSVITWVIEEYFAMSGTFILFGVLHCLAVCILAFALIEITTKLIAGRFKHYRFIKAGTYFLIAVALLVVNYTCNVTLYDANASGAVVESTGKFTGMFFYTNDWWTADYFPLLPFFGFFMLGASLSPIAYPNKKSLLPKLDGKWNKIFTIPGRYSLYIYLALQVLAVALLFVITLIVTGEVPFF